VALNDNGFVFKNDKDPQLDKAIEVLKEKIK
jgi:hypothetical protein